MMVVGRAADISNDKACKERNKVEWMDMENEMVLCFLLLFNENIMKIIIIMTRHI